ncbi:MAG: hypothetical protein Q8P69_02250 [bacterium]|nr:hypothetical protein [bacterium]
MQRTVNNRSSSVLVFKQTPYQYMEWRRMVKGGLQSMHMGWEFTSSLPDTVDDVVKLIQGSENLEIVVISNGIGMDSKVITQYALRIAKALKAHKYQPWVVLDESTDYLKVIFEEQGVEVKSGMIEFVIFDRWQSQIVREKVDKEEKAIADEEATQV